MGKMSIRAMMLTNKEFFQQACRWRDSTSVQTAASWWAAFQEVIIREVFYNGQCRVPGLGTFTVKPMEGYLKQQTMADGKVVTYKVPARQYPVFTAEDDFVNDINMQGVTRLYRKRLKKGELTQRDYERELRAKTVDIMDVVDDMMEQRREKAKEELQELLKTKRKLKIENDEPSVSKSNNAKPVIQMDMQGDYLAEFESITKAEEATGIKKIYISNCCNPLRRQKTAGGYKWKYANKQEEENVDDISEQSEVSDTEP